MGTVPTVLLVVATVSSWLSALGFRIQRDDARAEAEKARAELRDAQDHRAVLATMQPMPDRRDAEGDR